MMVKLLKSKISVVVLLLVVFEAAMGISEFEKWVLQTIFHGFGRRNLAWVFFSSSRCWGVGFVFG